MALASANSLFKIWSLPYAYSICSLYTEYWFEIYSTLQENFAANALNTRWRKNPLITCFFSSSNPSSSYLYLHAFERSLKKYNEDNGPKSKFRFGLVDVSNPQNSNSKLVCIDKNHSSGLKSILLLILKQGWRQENSDRGADASDEGANYFGTKALKPDRSSQKP